jgi:tetratricopeptide (TPR) repeat protein
MDTNAKRLGVAIVAVIIIGVLGYFAWKERSGSRPPIGQSASTTVIQIGSSTISLSTASQSGYTIREVPIESKARIVAPEHAVALQCASGVATDTCASAQAMFGVAQGAIASSSIDFNGWVTLGVARKEAGDYTGAAADWEYVSKLYPTNPVSFANLGDLYAQYLHEDAKAIASYKQALVNNPKGLYIYDVLYDLYTATGQTQLAAQVKAQQQKASQ